MTPIFYDSHMHTPLCKHATGEPEVYAQRGLAMRLKGIIFTCHSPMPRGFWPHVRMTIDEFDTYVNMISQTAQRFQGQLDVKLGIESDFFPGFEDWIADLHQKAEFHYCLGSVHWQGKEYRERFGTDDVNAFRSTYFRLLAESAETGLFDCLAHPDLIKTYTPHLWQFEAMEDIIAPALDRIAKTGVAMELNTSGVHKSYQETNPGPQMLKMMCDRGIPVVIGSDSHQAHRVGEGFFDALHTLTQAGYEKVSVFEHRKRQDLLICDVLASLRGEKMTL